MSCKQNKTIPYLLRSFLCLTILSIASGCGTLLHGRHANINVKSTPSGANVRTGYIKNCETPCMVKVKRGKPGSITVTKDGYKPYVVLLNKKFQFFRTIVGNLFWFYLGFPVDLISGGAYDISPTNINVKLKADTGSKKSSPKSVSKKPKKKDSTKPRVSAENLADLQAVKKIAVPLLSVSQLDESMSELLTEIITAEIAQMGHYTVISQSDINAMLGFDRQKELMGCDDVACTAELGGALGVDAILAGNVGVLGTTYVLSLKLINTQDATVLARGYDKVKGEPDQLLDIIKTIVREMLQQKKSRS
ncbi:MAG: PEGA domain-containing protein [Myxococcota bacterium]|jgi:hypothetical protein|nr:PEGA domain-containing protein [Myxococcota bacterium]